jgi:uncharacterized protein
MKKLRRRSMVWLAALLLPAACGRDADRPYTSPIAFDSAMVRVEAAADTFRMVVELAEREEQRAYGLMERSALDDDAGMLFLYPTEQPGSSGFWMYRTRIPLDIAFLDGDGVIVRILRMEPCPSPEPRWCPTYAPGAPYRAALEANAGFFGRRGVREGDRVVLERDAMGDT